MIACRYIVTLTVRAPVLSQAAGSRTLGIDAAALRHAGRPALPGSLIRGNLRHAWEYFADAASGVDGVPSQGEINRWLGKPSEEDPEDPARNSDEPKRGRLQFAMYWVAREAGGHGKRHRITIDPKSGAVEPRHLQIIEAPFAPGSDVLYEGHIDALCRDASEAESLVRWIRKGLQFTPALGAFKSAGFGRILAVKVTSNPREAPRAGDRTALPARFGIRLKLDRPFCFARPHPPKTNRYESEDFIPGGAILGAMARHVFPDGRDAPYSDDRWKPLRDAFHEIRITHVRREKKQKERGRSLFRKASCSIRRKRIRSPTMSR
jgi:CRISPR/Cas system CSM-associated protein Csm3 (group 7 of RAMP superfamily)